MVEENVVMMPVDNADENDALGQETALNAEKNVFLDCEKSRAEFRGWSLERTREEKWPTSGKFFTKKGREMTSVTKPNAVLC